MLQADFSSVRPSYTGESRPSPVGTDSNGVIYVYSANGAEWGAFKLTPLTGASAASTTQKYSVEAWIGLGYSNAAGNCGAVTASGSQSAYPGDWDTCSYGSMHLTANPATNVTEMTVAGLGFGYCGIQMISDGNNIFVAGSVDQGTTCGSLAYQCFASDAASPGTCTASDLAFSLTPLGRGPSAVQYSLSACNEGAYDQSHVNISQMSCNGVTWAVSNFPASSPPATTPTIPSGSPAVVLNGTATDALRFGPTTPTTGVGKLASQ